MEVIGSAGTRHRRAPEVQDGDGRLETVRELAQDARRTAAALRLEAQAACASARSIVADSLVITHVSMGLRSGALIGRCAWCGRHRIGDRWMYANRSHLVRESRTTHSICDGCVVALRELGYSV